MQSVLSILDTNLTDYLGEDAYKAFIDIEQQQKKQMKKRKRKHRKPHAKQQQ